jgi:hypothetical protein
MIGLSGVCVVGDRVQVLALPCSTPLGCEGSTPLLSGLGTGHPGDGRRTGSLCPCGACSLVVPLPGTLSFIQKKYFIFLHIHKLLRNLDMQLT